MFDKIQIVHNGNFVSGKLNDFYTSNRAFLYGDSIFETIFVRNGVIHYFEEHMLRLISGMKVLKYEVPDKFTVFKKKLESEIIQLLNKNKVFKSARVRLTVFRQSGGLYTPLSNKVDYIISCTESKHDKYVLNQTGLSIDVFKDIKKPLNIFSQYKTANSLIYTLAGIYKNEKKIDDCLILNDRDNIIETISSNIFLVKGKDIITPPISEGCINGIMRRQVIKFAEKYEINFYEATLSSEDLLNADEIFLTNSISGIKWVVAYKGKRYFKRVSNFLINKLNEQFD